MSQLSISTRHPFVTEITICQTNEGNQATVRDQLAAHQAMLPGHAGFVAALLLNSPDGKAVADYIQWTDRPAYEQYRETAGYQKFIADLTAGSAVSQQLCWVVITLPEAETIISDLDGFPLVLEEFVVQSGQQAELIERHKQAGQAVIQRVPGMASVNFHASFDGTRTYSFAQVRDLSSLSGMADIPGFEADHPYWQGLAEPVFQLYNLVQINQSNK